MLPEEQAALAKRATAGLDATFITHLEPTDTAAGSPQGLFLMDVAQELTAARKKFPHTGAVTVALMEEAGELAKALLDESPERIYREAVQVAAMAARCALEGDPTLDDYRKQHHGVDALPARGRRP